MVKQISDNEIYLLIKYIKSVLWRTAKRLSYIEDKRCLKVKLMPMNTFEKVHGAKSPKCSIFNTTLEVSSAHLVFYELI